MKTLATYFASLRAERDLTYDDIAALTGLHRTSAWKIEGGRPIRIETLASVATKALKLKKTDPEYKKLIGLWLKEQEILRPEDLSGLTRDLTVGHQQLIAAISKIPPADCEYLCAALKSKPRQRYLVAVAKA
jgi:transcriptional regulator with XRE-family HTH domain